MPGRVCDELPEVVVDVVVIYRGGHDRGVAGPHGQVDAVHLLHVGWEPAAWCGAEEPVVVVPVGAARGTPVICSAIEEPGWPTGAPEGVVMASLFRAGCGRHEAGGV